MTAKQKAYFQVLGIAPTNDKAVIKKAYRKKAFQYHPDRNKLASAHDMFIQLTEAYEYLTEGPKQKTKGGFTNQRTAEEVLAERMRAARARYKKAQKKEAEQDEAFYLKLTETKIATYYQWLGYAALFVGALWMLDYSLQTNELVSRIEGYSWYGRDVCFDVGSDNYCFDSRQGLGVGTYYDFKAYFSPLFGDLKYITMQNYDGLSADFVPERTFYASFPFVPLLMVMPFLTWRLRRPAPGFVFSFFVSSVLVSGILLFRLGSLLF